MTSSQRSLEKVITAHPRPYQIILFLVYNPSFQSIQHSISTTPPSLCLSISLYHPTVYVCVCGCVCINVWACACVCLLVLAARPLVLCPREKPLFSKPLANPFTHMPWQLSSREPVFYSQILPFNPCNHMDVCICAFCM